MPAESPMSFAQGLPAPDQAGVWHSLGEAQGGVQNHLGAGGAGLLLAAAGRTLLYQVSSQVAQVLGDADALLESPWRRVHGLAISLPGFLNLCRLEK